MEKKFEEAARTKLRFTTSQGNMTVEDMWDLPLTKLNSIAKALNKMLKDADEEDFLDTKDSSDKLLQLSFDIVKYILDVKKAEADAKKDAVARKAERARIMELIARKDDEELNGLTKEELLAKLSTM